MHMLHLNGGLTRTACCCCCALVSYGTSHVALLAGSMVRECLRIESVCDYLLRDGRSLAKMFETCVRPCGRCVCMWCLAAQRKHTLMSSRLWLWWVRHRFVHSNKFEVSSDVLATLRELFTYHKTLVATFLKANYDATFAAYKKLLDSKNYVTRRQSLKLLGELLLDRNNREVMMRYVGDRQNLRTIMMLLSDPRPNIQFEAFHVFKVPRRWLLHQHPTHTLVMTL